MSGNRSEVFHCALTRKDGYLILNHIVDRNKLFEKKIDHLDSDVKASTSQPIIQFIEQNSKSLPPKYISHTPPSGNLMVIRVLYLK